MMFSNVHRGNRKDREERYRDRKQKEKFDARRREKRDYYKSTRNDRRFGYEDKMERSRSRSAEGAERESGWRGKRREKNEDSDSD